MTHNNVGNDFSRVRSCGWGKYQTAQEMEINRKYEYDRVFFKSLYRWLGLESARRVVDVGCGGGYFTRILARGLKSEGRIVGVDPDRSLILDAEKISREQGFSNASFKVGNIWRIPFGVDYADVTVCHIVLRNIPRQFEAILEMKRVTRTGGKVVVIDPAFGGAQYFPDEDLDRLFQKFGKAFGVAIDKEWRQKLNMSDYIETVYLRLPQLFLKAGLADITLNGYLSTFLLCDARRTVKEMQGHVKTRLELWQRLKRRNKECALTGGMKEEKFDELFQKYSDYLRSLTRNPEEIRQTAEVEIRSRVVVCGVKV
jgi:ubiquinone/menaquinone biosynthesis C-methylase UbiE